MKKKYIAPELHVIGISLEGMVANSNSDSPSIDPNKQYGDASSTLSERSGWSSDNWSEE